MKISFTSVLLITIGSVHAQINDLQLENNQIEFDKKWNSKIQYNEGLSGYWNDTTVRFCAYRIPNGGSALSPWWFESSTYVGSQLMNVYSSYYSSNSVSYSRQDYAYTAAYEKEVMNYSSSDSLNWVFDNKSRIREFKSVVVDSLSTYDWNAGMNIWIPQYWQTTYKTNNAPDSMITKNLGIPTGRKIWYRSNGILDSIVEYGYESGSWLRNRWEHFYGFYSITQSTTYAPIKRYYNVQGNIYATVNFDIAGQRMDSTRYYYNNINSSELDSSIQYDANNLILSAVGYRIEGRILKIYNWNSQLALSSYQFRFSNVNGFVHGSEVYDSNGQLRSKWGVCEVFNSLNMNSDVNELKLYPNPNSGNFRIEGLAADVEYVELWDLHGHLLRSVPVFNEKPIEIQLSGNAAGIYRAVIYGKDGQVTLPVYVRY